MKIVPDEPTEEMLDAAAEEDDRASGAVAEFDDIYKAMIAAAASPWISVEDRLPEDGVFSLFIDTKCTMNRELFHIDYVRVTDAGIECVYNYLHNYTHWMPLPSPSE